MDFRKHSWGVYTEHGKETIYVVWSHDNEQEFVFHKYDHAKLLCHVFNVVDGFALRKKPR